MLETRNYSKRARPVLVLSTRVLFSAARHPQILPQNSCAFSQKFFSQNILKFAGDCCVEYSHFEGEPRVTLDRLLVDKNRGTNSECATASGTFKTGNN